MMLRLFIIAVFAISPAYAQRVLAPVYPTPYALMTLGPNKDPAISYVGRTELQIAPLIAGEHTTVIVIFGDSLGSASDNAPYAVTHPDKVQELSLDNGRLYKSQPPALSCGGPGNDPTMGFWGHRLADKLIDGGKSQRVILACISVNGTGTADWLTSPYAVRIYSSWGLLNQLGILAADRIFILSSIGAWDQINAVPAATVTANLTTIATYFRQAGFLSTPIYFALSSYGAGTGGANGVAVRTGITNAISSIVGAKIGADTDTIPPSERYDTAGHLNAIGAANGSDHQATLWYNVIQGSFP